MIKRLIQRYNLGFHIGLTKNISSQFAYQNPYDQSYESEARKIIMDFIVNRQRQNESDQIQFAIKSFKKLRGCRFGIVLCQEPYAKFLDQIEEILLQRMQGLNRQMPVKRIERELLEIKSLYKVALEFQLQYWSGIQSLMTWMSLPTTQNLFVYCNQPLLMLRYFNLLHQNGVDVDRFNKNIENLVDHFSYRGLQNTDDQIEWLYGITVIRPMEEKERIILKSGLRYYSHIQDRVLVENKRFQEVLGEYIALNARVYYPSATSSFVSPDDSDEDFVDEEVDSALMRCFQTLLNQDAVQYNRQLIEHELREDNYFDNMGLVDPMSWRTLSNATTGLQVLATRGCMQNDTLLHRLEQAVDRKLETDVAHLGYGTHVANVISCFSNSDPNVMVKILQSVCDQIKHERSDRVAVSHQNLCQLLKLLLRLEQLSGDKSEGFIRPGIQSLIRNIIGSCYDQKMRKVDWFEINEIANEYQLTQLKSYSQQKLDQ